MMSRRAYAASNGQGGFSSVCAIGASALVVGALQPLGPTRYMLSFEALYTAFPELAMPDLACPHCGTRATLHEVIVDLNDNHFWTREKIADWIEQQTLEFDDSPMPSGTNTCGGHGSASMPVRPVERRGSIQGARAAVSVHTCAGIDQVPISY